MAKVDFWQLERSVQERFIACTEGAAAPRPLAVRPRTGDRPVLVFVALGLLSLIGTLLGLCLGFGDLRSRYALSGTGFILVDAFGFSLAAFGFLRAATQAALLHAVPYRPALYLFPIGVIDARTPEFAVHRISENSTANFDGERHWLRVVIDGQGFEFPTEDRARAELVAASIDSLRQRFREAGPESNARARALIDPLLDNGFKNPFAPSESLRRVLPGWLRLWPGLALILGVLLGGMAFAVRNHLSEERLYRAARSADRSETYRLYLARGGSNPDVESLLLPRAELRDAVRQGNVAAIERLLAAHPNSPIEPELSRALQQALLAELRVAEIAGTLSALKAFSAKYASYSFLEPDIDRALNAAIEATMLQLRPLLAANQNRLLPFIERLLHYTGKHGPEAALRFQRKPTETLESTEKALRKSAYFSGEAALPGRYFDAAHAEPRESAVATSLLGALGAHFPPELLHLQRAPTLGATSELQPIVPTLLISYHTEMAGAFTSRRPRLALPGIGLICKASFEIPGDPEPLSFKLTVWRAPNLKTLTETSTPSELYEAMATEAFKRFTKKYLATWFSDH